MRGGWVLFGSTLKLRLWVVDVPPVYSTEVHALADSIEFRTYNSKTSLSAINVRTYVIVMIRVWVIC